MHMTLPWPEGTLILLATASFCILGVLIYRMGRSEKPDPHITLLLALMKNLPQDQNSGSGGGTPDPPESEEELGPLGPSGFGSFG
jgi:hypothetical protein